MNRIKWLIVALFAAAVLAAGGTAIQAQDKFYNPTLIQVGGLATVKGHLIVRDAAPSQIAGWYSKGNKIGVAEPGHSFEIVDIKYLPVLWGDPQKWVKVKWRLEMIDPSKQSEVGDLEHVDGWVYYGGPDYFEMVDKWKKQ